MREKIIAMGLLAMFILSVLSVGVLADDAYEIIPAKDNTESEPVSEQMVEIEPGNTGSGGSHGEKYPKESVTEQEIIKSNQDLIDVKPKAIESWAVKSKTESIKVKPTLVNAEPKLIKARQITVAKITEAKEKLIHAKEMYVAVQERFVEKQEIFREKKQELSECRNSDSSECREIKQEIKVKAKDYLANSADKVIASLERIKARIEGSEDLTEEEASELISQIGKKITAMQTAKESAEEDDKEAIVSAAKEIKKEWTKTRRIMKKAANRLIHVKIAGILTKTNHLETRFQNVLDKLEADGVDVGLLQERLDAFSIHLKEANQAYEQARLKWTAGAIDDMNSYNKEAHSHLKEAHAELRELFVGIKQAKGGEEALEAPEERLEEGEE